MTSKYRLCSAELICKQTELEQLSAAFTEHKEGCSKERCLVDENMKEVMAQMLQQDASSSIHIKDVEDSNRRLTDELEEMKRSFKETQQLFVNELRVTATLQQHADNTTIQNKTDEESISRLTRELQQKTRSLEEEQRTNETEASF